MYGRLPKYGVERSLENVRIISASVDNTDDRVVATLMGIDTGFFHSTLCTCACANASSACEHASFLYRFYAS